MDHRRQTVAQSGQPYSVYDYSGSVAGQYYGSSDYITNPIVPLLPGVTAKQAELQGTTGINANNPVLNAADFGPQFVAPGTYGVFLRAMRPDAISMNRFTAVRAATCSARRSRCVSI
jgi:hypothetical protein